MNLLYKSTRNSDKTVTASQAILKGLADDGGLFVPVSVPKLDVTMDELKDMSYQETAYAVMKQFFTDFTEEELKHCINSAYDSKFDTEVIAPLVKVGDTYHLELFHGATIAFKDMALSILPHLMITSARKNQVKNDIVILTATSGDTGKAALAGFADVPGTKIIVFYPKGGVSRVQELQMVTQKGENTSVVAIHGNFDHAQSGVKALFEDKELEKELGFEEKYLPLLWADAEGLEKDIRFQYMDIVTRLYNENFTQVLGDWCRAHHVWYLGHTIEDNGAHARLGYGTGHYYRGQQGMDFAGIDVIGGQIVPGMNYHHDAFNTGGSNGEFYHYALAKLAASSAHLDPAKKGRAMCEAFGAYGWNEGLKMMKWIADHLLVRGINYLVPHAFDPKKFPDFDCPPHFYAHGHNPQFRYFKVFSDYVNRICQIFRDGKYPSETGLLYPAELEWGGNCMPLEKPCRELTEHQIPYDIVTRDWIMQAEIGDGFFEINGCRMKNLVIPYGEGIPSDIVPMLKKMVEHQVQIYFLDALPDVMLGFSKNQEAFEYVQTHASVIALEQLGETLAEYRKVFFAQVQPDLAVGEYERDGQRYYMIFNENIGKTIRTEISLPHAEHVYRYDAFSGKTYEVSTDPASGKFFLSLEPYESVVLLESEENLPAEAVYFKGADMAADQEKIALPEKWNVQFADSFSWPKFTEKVPVEELCCVQEIAGWEKKAGTLQFSSELKLEYEISAVLDLGEVFETAEVKVNGISAGLRLCRPYRFDLTGLLKKGENQITIEVTNCLGTALRDPISHYLMIEPFGIEGPVVMKKIQK